MRLAKPKTQKTPEPDSFEHGYNYALFLLNIHLRTAGEIRRKMTQRGYQEEVIVEVIEALTKERLVDDQRYAEVFLENLKQYQNYGLFMIKKKFMLKLLPAVLIEQILTENLSLEDEVKIAQRYVARQTGLTQDKQKLARRLQTRGFRGEVISRLVFDSPDFHLEE